MATRRLDLYPGGRKRGDWPITLFTIRRPTLLAVGISGRGHSFGLNLHRHAGISLSGLPAEGGTSVLWGTLGRKVKVHASDLRRRVDLGPVIVAVGSDF